MSLKIALLGLRLTENGSKISLFCFRVRPITCSFRKLPGRLEKRLQQGFGLKLLLLGPNARPPSRKSKASAPGLFAPSIRAAYHRIASSRPFEILYIYPPETSVPLLSRQTPETRCASSSAASNHLGLARRSLQHFSAPTLSLAYLKPMRFVS